MACRTTHITPQCEHTGDDDRDGHIRLYRNTDPTDIRICENCRHMILDLGTRGQRRDYRCDRNNMIVATYYISNWTCDRWEGHKPSVNNRL